MESKAIDYIEIEGVEVNYSQIKDDCSDSQADSEGNLVIDDDDDNSKHKRTQRRTRPLPYAAELLNLTCGWLNCGEFYTQYGPFTEHVLTHAEEDADDDNRYQCRYNNCEYSTTAPLLFARHAAFHAYHEWLKNIGVNEVARAGLPKCHNPARFAFMDLPSYECSWARCDFRANIIQEYFAHVRTHAQGFRHNDTIRCEWLGCAAKCSSPYRLSDHLRTHTGERRIACPTCGTMLVSKTRLCDHLKRQLPVESQRYQCADCSKLFATKRLLRDHMRDHINYLRCTMCDMTCSRPYALANHIRHRHMDERPFKCSLCQHCAMSKCNLAQHMTTHLMDDMYVCEYCEFRCRSLFGLERHVQKEHMEADLMLYECHCCLARFTRGAQLTQHLLKRHEFKWPSGHSRFKYKQDDDGCYRLQMIRFEMVEASAQETKRERPPPPLDPKSKYNMKITANHSGRIPSIVVTIKKEGEDDNSENGE